MNSLILANFAKLTRGEMQINKHVKYRLHSLAITVSVM